jgi:FMN phosphatase YigB (HAD superfamily)
MDMKKLIVFDVNETLLDLKALDPKFEQDLRQRIRSDLPGLVWC